MKSRPALVSLIVATALALAGCTGSVPVLEAPRGQQADGLGAQSPRVVKPNLDQQSVEQSSVADSESSSGPQSSGLQSDAPSTVSDLLAAIPEPETVAQRFQGVEPTVWGMEIAGIYRTLPATEQPTVALTLDACGGPHGSDYDADLIEGLVARGVPATLFINSRWIDSNPGLSDELAANPLFELANHGTAHQPLSVTGRSAYGIPGTSSPLGAAQEVWGNDVRLTELTGQRPRYFRAGTAHYDDVGLQVADAFGQKVVGFTVNADGGATFDADTVYSQVVGAPSGSVIIAHMNQPAGQTAEGMLPAIDDLLAKGYKFAYLDSITR